MEDTPNSPGERESEPVPERTLPIKPTRLPVDETTSSAAAPPTREEFHLLAAQVRRLAAQITHGRT